MEPRAAFAHTDEEEGGWLAEADLARALSVAGVAVTAEQAAACVARLVDTEDQEEDGFLSVDEFERVCGWHAAPTLAALEPEPEPEPAGAAAEAAETEDKFDTQEYWEKFNEEGGTYDWYGGDGLQESIVCAVKQQAAASTPDAPLAARVLDVGTGTDTLLFALVEGAGFTDVHGTDWSHRACDYMTEQSAERGLTNRLQYRQADGRRLDDAYEAGSFDVVLDKGCLDCFVSGRGHGDIATYFGQLRRLLTPGTGRLLLIPVNGAHIPTLLATGAVVREAHMQQHGKKPGGGSAQQQQQRSPACEALSASQITAAKDEAWRQHCAAAASDAGGGGTEGAEGGAEAEAESSRTARLDTLLQGGEGKAAARLTAWALLHQSNITEEKWVQPLFIEKVIATEEKHIFVCAAEPPPLLAARPSPPPLECGGCGSKFASRSYPEVCGRCRNKLVRFALS